MSDPRIVHVVIHENEEEQDSRNDTPLGRVIEGIVDFVEDLRGGKEEDSPHSIWNNADDDRGNYNG